ncbi:MAG TPA: VIT family protein [Thermoanaerobaculia bacterium]
MPHIEHHRITRASWLRAAVMGANDGIVSTASLVVGVAAANADRAAILLAGVAGVVAGAFSMAAGEYVSVSSQADMERADLKLEQAALATHPDAEEDELTEIYERRGLEPDLARVVAQRLMAHDALGAHARDELGLSEVLSARPLTAALASAGTFLVGGAIPILTVLPLPGRVELPVALVALVCLATMGALAARAGGASPWRGALRVTFWSTVAMLATFAVGHIFGTTVG